MPKLTLGRTGIVSDKNAFGALPVQRVDRAEADYLLKTAFDDGITYFDTARAYSDSEEKLGLSLSGVRDKISIATKTMSTTAEGFWDDLHKSLSLLKTDYIDVYQLHNPAFCPLPGDESGLYDSLLKAKEQGKIRFIGITNHRISVATEAVNSGLYDVLQYPFSYLSNESEIELTKLCKERDVGFVAMKALSGGLITSSGAAYAYLSQFDNVLPIWGIQKREELLEFLSYIESPPAMTDEYIGLISKDREQLLGEFCRGCGYCMPCPAGIDIANSARMSLLLRRAPSTAYLTPEWREKMNRIEECTGCGGCKSRCPYSLDTPRLLRDNLDDYKTFC